MVKVKKVLVAISMLFLASMSLGGTNGDEDLLKQAKQIFSPLPKLMLSEKNSITPEKVRLGKLLFYETRISVDGTVSCSKCHPIS
jgi:cytochrome c peroxidase